ncbi:MAG: hypothetical protein ACK5LN_04545 [Propioniciclava sp.]
MARRPSKHLRTPRPLHTAGFARTQEKSDGSWQVQSMPADRANKLYTCPSCQRPIALGTAHVVAWPSETPLGQSRAVDGRRHWHISCWERRR